MGRLVRTQRIGEGMHIRGEGRSIDLTILKIKGRGYHKRVKLRVEGVDGLKELELSHGGELVKLIENISVGVGDSHEKDLKKVSMVYSAPEEYKLNREEFGDQGNYTPHP
jgi:hypothetical protein